MVSLLVQDADEYSIISFQFFLHKEMDQKKLLSDAIIRRVLLKSFSRYFNTRYFSLTERGTYLCVSKEKYPKEMTPDSLVHGRPSWIPCDARNQRRVMELAALRQHHPNSPLSAVRLGETGRGI
jgi:hypothetical protein